MFLSPRRYAAPHGDGETLIDPPLSRVSQLISQAQALQRSASIFGMSLAAWREAARKEILTSLGEQSRPVTWIVNGHEPEFFHPGVWLKNFVAGELAKKHDGIAIHLIVDNDVPKSSAVRVPVWRPGIAAEQVTVNTIPFDEPPNDAPYEEWAIRNGDLFESFPDRLRAATSEWLFHPIGLPNWRAGSYRIMDHIASLRQNQERQWGLHIREFRVSLLSDTAAFTQFINAIVEDLPRFHDCYNKQLRAYRKANNIKSRHHPVPELAQDGDWLEAPFWCWTSEEPRRRRPFVRRTANGLRWRVVRREANWPATDLKVRPRALTLTMFARLALADVFVHGIGGAKYDELTDAISARYFGFAPPHYLVITGTLRAPFPKYAAALTDLRAVMRRERELLWSPQRVISAPELATERASLIARPIVTRLQRRERARLLRKNLERWQPLTVKLLAQAAVQQAQAQSERVANEVLGSRELAWPLYPAELLRNWLTQQRVP